MTEPFDAYLRRLRETPLDEQTEHTGRTALELLLQHFAGATGDTNVQHEPKRQQDKGAPDFKITRHGMILGYVENKQIGANLDATLKSDQIKRYRTLSDNILLTDYLHFVWIGPDGVRGRETLAFPTDLEGRTIAVNPDKANAVANLLEGFFSEAPEGIGRAKSLALALAHRARLLRDYIGEELVRQQREHTEGRLHGLYSTFREQIFQNLTVADFADAYAQMLAYGLFLARLNSGDGKITLENAREHVPAAFRLIRELVGFLNELNLKEYTEVRWVVEEVLSIVNGLDLAAISTDLSFAQRKSISRKVRAGDEEEHRLFERDPFIYFYEDFLKAYDKDMRKARGVYYTPPPVVNFIVRAIDDILKDTFEIEDGLADHNRVTLLDFACGTGTFLLEVFERIFDNIGGPESGRADLIVREHLLRNIFGFEYLIAPYTIAHLKLSQYLKDKQHGLTENERLKIYLTNTLEPVAPQANLLVPAITAEVAAAQRVKEQPILVITGNPPYSGNSKNKSPYINSTIDGYKFTIETDGNGNEFKKPLGEKNPKWLNDDYVNFIRFAQLKMDAVDEGVVGIITNHSWLDNPTFRGMRQSLMRSFEQIYVLDLHGNTKKKEKAPDGSKDENVFDIEQGVAISLFVKRKGLERAVWRGDLWGERLEKYRTAANISLGNYDWRPIKPVSPDFLLLESIGGTEDVPWKIDGMFTSSSVGVVTGHDAEAVQFERDQIDKVLTSQQSSPEAGETVKYKYRPFDDRFTFYDGKSQGFHVRPRSVIMRHFVGNTNVGLAVSRQSAAIGSNSFDAVAVVNAVTDFNYFRRGGEQLFPLMTDSTENLSPDFREYLDERYQHHYAPEEVLGYIYAVLHAPAYRQRFAEFLRIDFPRIPFAETRAQFDELSALGWELVEAHLLRALPRAGLAAYHGKGGHIVEKPAYVAAEQALFINKSQKFMPVPEPVWNFHIGGYQVLDKYLKSRKGRTLSLDEINHIAQVADSLAFTITQMEKIDAAYTKAFPSGG